VGSTISEGSTSPTQCGCQPGSGGVNCAVSAVAVPWNQVHQPHHMQTTVVSGCNMLCSVFNHHGVNLPPAMPK
jgi:hypothetical protein